MAETRIILSLDDQQFVQRLKASIGDVNTFEKAIKQAKKSTEEIAPGAVTGSIKDLSDRLADARTKLLSLTQTSPGYEQALKRVQVLTGHVSRAQLELNNSLRGQGAASNQAAAGAGNATTALMSLSGIVQDLPYGIRGIANNIQFFSQQAVYLIASSGGIVNGFKAMAGAMMGPAGILFLISAVTSALDYFSVQSNKSQTETKKLAQEMEELDGKLRTLKASFDDLAEGQTTYRKSVVTGEIDQLKKYLAAVQDELKRGGRVVGAGDRPIYVQYSSEELERFRKEIDKTEKKITELQNSTNKYVTTNITLLKGLTAAASGGSKSIEDFAKKNKLSEGQLGSLLSQLKAYEKDVQRIGGGLAGQLAEDQREIAIKLGLQKQELEKSLPVIQKYYDAISGKKQKQAKTEDVEFEKIKIQYELFQVSYNDYKTFLEKRLTTAKQNTDKELTIYKQYKEELKGLLNITADVKPVSFNFESKDQEEVFNKIKADFERRGITWDDNAKAFAIKTALATPDTLLEKRFQMSPVETGTKPDPQKAAKLTKGELIGLQAEADIVEQSFAKAGRAIVDAMFGAKLSVADLGKEIAKLAVQIALMAGIKSLMAVLFPISGAAMAVSAGAGGGISGELSGRAVVNPAVFKGAKQFASGGLTGGGIPSILHPGEIVVNKTQQQELFRALNSRRLASQVNQNGTIKVSGKMTANKNQFVWNIENARSDFYKSSGGIEIARG